MTITVYSKPACVQCNATYRALDKFKGQLSYTVIDISVDEAARDYAKGLGHLTAPVVVIKDAEGNLVDHWGGYNPDKIKHHADALVAA